MRLVHVEVHATPAALLVAADDYLGELLRELTLIREGRRTGVAVGDHPERLLALMEEILTRYAGARVGSREQAEACLAAGRVEFTTVLELPPEAADAAERFLAVLEALQGYSRQGVLLTLPPRPSVAGFLRQWLDEVLRQLRDAAAPRLQPFRLPADDTARDTVRRFEPDGSGPDADESERLHAAMLERSPRAPAQARQLMGDWLGGRQGADDARLLVSELVTNALLHGQGRLRLVLRLSGSAARIEVHDAGPPLPELYQRELDAGTGRGLLIIQALGRSWGSQPLDDGGKAVWVELDTPPVGTSEEGRDADQRASQAVGQAERHSGAAFGAEVPPGATGAVMWVAA